MALEISSAKDDEARSIAEGAKADFYRNLGFGEYLRRLVLAVISMMEGEESASEVPCMVESIEQYMRDHHQDDINAEDLGERFGLSISYLSRAFAKYKGMSPMKCLTNIRVENACMILSEYPETPVQEVAKMVGYSDAFYFSRVFKKARGVSPATYRRIRGIQ